MEVLITSDQLQNRKPEINLGLSDCTNEPLRIMVPEFFMNVVKVFQCKEMRWFHEYPVSKEWLSNPIQAELLCLAEEGLDIKGIST